MITHIADLPENILGFNYSGEVTGADYETVLFPAFAKAANEQNKLHVIIRFDDTFSSINIKAMMDDALVGIKYFSNWERVAIVSDHSAINHAIHAFTFLMPGKIKVFPSAAFNDAVTWVSEAN